jgi:hypothetical protein
VSNPVQPPPPSYGGGYPPPANQGFGGPAQPQQGQPGFPPGDQQGFGAAPAQPKKKGGIGKKLLPILLVVLLAIGAFVVKTVFLGDKAKDAVVGDCIATPKDVAVGEEAETAAEVVKCDSAKADYTVVGRVNGETSTDSKSCDQFFKEGEDYVVLASQAGGGYLLCLRPKK